MAAQHDIHTTVSVTKKVSVYSKALHPSEILELSNLDRQCPILMYLVFFYKPSHAYQELSIETIFGRLKAGLEETLSIWYPAAGRLNINSSDGKLNISCNNGGAILVEAVTQAKISELGDLSSYNEFYENLVFKLDINGNITELPLVVAQVTKFSCGGYSLGVGISHSLFDGSAGCHFLSAWASQFNMRSSELYEPVHERGRLLIGNFHNHKMSTDDVGIQSSKAARVAAIDHLYQMIKEAKPDQEHNESYVIRTFRFSADMIESLKKKVYGGKGENFPCSSFEVLAAHLWKVRTRALVLNQERMVCLQFAVDARNKTASPLPKGFSGNAYVLASVASTARNLEEQSYEYIIKRIKEAKNSVTDDYVNAYIQSLEGPQATTLPSLQELTIVTDWTKLPYQKVDFFGEIACVAPLVPPVPQVAYFMPNPDEYGGIDVRVGLLPKTQDAFAHLFVMDL